MKYIFNIVALLTVAGCKTTNPLVSVNNDTKEISLYASSERGSALKHAANSRQINKTITVLEAKVIKAPGDVALHLDLARLYLIKNDLPSARAMVKKALYLDLHNVKASKLLAEVEIADGNLVKAEIILSRLIEIKKGDADTNNLLGLIALRRNDLDGAYAQFQSGLKLDPTNIALCMNTGILYLKYRQFGEAEKQFKKVLKQLPEHTDAMLHLAIVNSVSGDDGEAADLYKKTISLDPSNSFAYYNFALLKFRKKQWSDSLDLVTSALNTKELSNEEEDKAQNLKQNILAEIKKQEDERKEREQKEKAAKSLAAKALDPKNIERVKK